MNEFRIPPVSPLIGSTILNYFKILGHHRIEPRFYFKIFLTTLVVLISTPFHWWEKWFFQRRLAGFEFEKPPLFIIGHWRSGTTVLHNVLCRDPAAGYLTTFHSVFPNNLASKWLFGTFMKLKMPVRRPSDNIELNIDFPQEDEFALSNCQYYAYYNFFYFPSHYAFFYEKAILHKNLTENEIESWYRIYDELLKKALINTGGKRLIIKNPVNTARISRILKLYPDAKFLYIYRNPMTVFYSTQNFFRKLLPAVWLNRVGSDFIDQMIVDIYVRLMHDYHEQKSLIPPGNLMELRFEDFEKDPLTETSRIYKYLLNEDFESVKPDISAYLETISKYRKNRYATSRSALDSVLKNWQIYMDLYKYSVPEDIEIKASAIKKDQ
jgi:hypothetical protein